MQLVYEQQYYIFEYTVLLSFFFKCDHHQSRKNSLYYIHYIHSRKKRIFPNVDTGANKKSIDDSFCKKQPNCPEYTIEIGNYILFLTNLKGLHGMYLLL